MRVNPPSSPRRDGGMRIMIVDDHEISRAASRALLRTEGMDVVADMAVGNQAIAAAAVLRPDVVVVDVSPGASGGLGMAWRLRALPDPPAVVLTSSAESAEFGARLDGYCFIAKADLCAKAIRGTVPQASLPGRRRPARLPGASPATLPSHGGGGPDEGPDFLRDGPPVGGCGQPTEWGEQCGHIHLRGRAAEPCRADQSQRDGSAGRTARPGAARPRRGHGLGPSCGLHRHPNHPSPQQTPTQTSAQPPATCQQHGQSTWSSTGVRARQTMGQVEISAPPQPN